MVTKKYSDVNGFLADLEPSKKEQVELLRSMILSVSSELSEHIKWNAPSYVLNGEDRITFNILNKEGVVKVILHMGALRKENKKVVPILREDSGLVVWQSDIRGAMSFATIEDIKNRQADIQQVLAKWLAIA